MIPKTKREESGQILVLLALVLVGLLGFTALSIDGGVIFSDRRYDQSAADQAALAGAGKIALTLDKTIRYHEFDCTKTNLQVAMSQAEMAAITKAAQTNFTIDDDLSDGLGVEVICNQSGSSYKDKYVDVHVRITSTSDTSFMHLFYDGEVTNTVDAVVRVRPRTPYVFGNAIVSLNKDTSACKNDMGINVHGDIVVKVDGAGIFSNNCMNAEGSKLEVDLTHDLNHTGVSFVTQYVPSGHPTFPPGEPHKVTDTLPDMPPLAVSCSGTLKTMQMDGTWNEPGRYAGFKSSTNANVVNLKPGLYCMEGDVDLIGGTLNGYGVTIYLDGANFYTGGNAGKDAVIHLFAPTDATWVSPAVKGLLIYMRPDYAGIIRMRGTSDSEYTGTVLAPKGDIDCGGNSELTSVNAQLIGYNVAVGGSSNLSIYFDQSKMVENPSRLDVQQ